MKLFDILRNYNFVCCLFDKSVAETKTTRKFLNVFVCVVFEARLFFMNLKTEKQAKTRKLELRLEKVKM